MNTALTKQCYRCKEVKRLSEFYENSTKPDHRNGICKRCQGEVDRENRSKPTKN